MVSLQDFLDYFLAPKMTGYDVPKTLTYALILVAAVYLLFRMLGKLRVRIDRRLALAITPYIVLGSSVRVLEDMGILNSYIFVTPGIYILVASVFITTLLISVLIERKKGVPYFKPTFIVGVLLMSLPLANLSVSNPVGLVYVGSAFLPWIAIFYLFRRFGLANRVVACVQMFDASVTFVALQFFGNVPGSFGFYEQHIVPTFIMGIFGPASFIFVKLAVVVASLILIDRLSDDKEFSGYLKLVIGILGLATGTRDFIALLTLV
jgi:uncharacterized membrane protein